MVTSNSVKRLKSKAENLKKKDKFAKALKDKAKQLDKIIEK